MIFALRGIMVSLAFFAIVYSFLSLSLALAWRCLRFSRVRKKISARSLFALRVMPFAVSMGISLFLTLPSFLLLERHSLDEDLGTFVLSACALLILGGGLYRVLAAEMQTRRVVSVCLEDTSNHGHVSGNPTIVLSESIPPLMLVGIRAPRILIAASACRVLTDAELQAAVRHETVHFRSRDNLKKAILNCLTFPGMASLEEAWQEASELAADDGAVSSRHEALDLAAALIKLARHFPAQRMPSLATGLVSAAGSITDRVERLIAWRESSVVNSKKWRFGLAAALLFCFGLAAKLGPALVFVHSLTERLVP